MGVTMALYTRGKGTSDVLRVPVVGMADNVVDLTDDKKMRTSNSDKEENIVILVCT